MLNRPSSTSTVIGTAIWPPLKLTSFRAYQKINAAQRDNQNQLGSHAQRAKDLLTQADEELRFAANVSNAERR
ncbi:MAG TPA: hypothetical protein VIX42_06080 [Edaphobacter sp.]